MNTPVSVKVAEFRFILSNYRVGETRKASSTSILAPDKCTGSTILMFVGFQISFPDMQKKTKSRFVAVSAFDKCDFIAYCW